MEDGNASMDDDGALLALAAGDAAEKSWAKNWILDKYFAPLIAALENLYRFDPGFAATGAGSALMDLFSGGATLGDKIAERSPGIWGWLLRRGRDRARNEHRRHHRELLGYRPVSDPIDLDDLHDNREAGDLAQVDADGRLRSFLFEAVPKLDPVDRNIFLHDLVWRYGLLTPGEAVQVDDEYLSRAQPDDLYTPEALKKRRQRLHRKLRELPALRGIR